MADSDVQITAGSGTKIDTRTVGAGTDEHRQVVVLGDPSTAANVASIDSSGRISSLAQGDIANNDVDSGNPIKIGGHAVGGTPAGVSSDDRVDAWFGTLGQLIVGLGIPQTPADGLTTTDAIVMPRTASSQIPTVGLGVLPYAFNGTTLDRLRGNTTGLFVHGGTAHDATDAGNPVKIGGYASAAAPTAVSASGDRVNAWFDLSGRQVVAPASGTPGIAVGGMSSFANRYTATQTSTNLVAGTAGQRIYVSHLIIATGGTTAGRVSLYWGTGAFTAGTSPTLFDGEFAPSATSRPGAVIPFPIAVGASSATGDNLRITTDAAITVYITLKYWKV